MIRRAPKKKRSSHGGSREGAGRRALVEDGTPVSTVLPVEAVVTIDKMAAELGVSRAVTIRQMLLQVLNRGLAPSKK